MDLTPVQSLSFSKCFEKSYNSHAQNVQLLAGGQTATRLKLHHWGQLLLITGNQLISTTVTVSRCVSLRYGLSFDHKKFCSLSQSPILYTILLTIKYSVKSHRSNVRLKVKFGIRRQNFWFKKNSHNTQVINYCLLIIQNASLTNGATQSHQPQTTSDVISDYNFHSLATID